MKKRDRKAINRVLRRAAAAYNALARHTQRHCLMISEIQERLTKVEEALSIERKKGLN